MICPKKGFQGYFSKNYQSNSFDIWHSSLWGQTLEPYSFSCFYHKLWLCGGQVTSYYLNQWWNIIQENAFENVVWKMAAILSQPQCVKCCLPPSRYLLKSHCVMQNSVLSGTKPLIQGIQIAFLDFKGIICTECEIQMMRQVANDKIHHCKDSLWQPWKQLPHLWLNDRVVIITIMCLRLNVDVIECK